MSALYIAIPCYAKHRLNRWRTVSSASLIPLGASKGSLTLHAQVLNALLPSLPLHHQEAVSLGPSPALRRQHQNEPGQGGQIHTHSPQLAIPAMRQFTMSGMAENSISAGNSVEQLESSRTVGGNIKWHTTSENSFAVS